MSLLEVDAINSFYGDSHILFDVSLRVEEHECVALLGRNGAGKTTTLRSIMGVLSPGSGTIRLDGKPIQGRPPYEIARLGMQLVPEERAIFGALTVEENLRLAALTAPGAVSAASRRFSSTVSAPKIARSSGTSCMPSRAISWGGRPWIGLPSSRMVPLPGDSTPMMLRSVVVLPAPLRPSNATHSCSSTRRETSNRMWLSP